MLPTIYVLIILVTFLSVSLINNHLLKNVTNYKKETIYIIYSIFVFIALLIIETFFVFRFIAAQYEINSFKYMIYFCIAIGFDLTSVGDYYFFIFTR